MEDKAVHGPDKAKGPRADQDVQSKSAALLQGKDAGPTSHGLFSSAKGRVEY
ncbi:hypothetical protein JCGZ_06927 [Jatropha curcas]|uniref:Uncharacterized protein n=1 Tax=Jatropha curcas TaxID=180498 RepID=A0A067KZI2_JATCU|nr:hypothetical protein JCGZ_06927 [Jatropha curcas]